MHVIHGLAWGQESDGVLQLESSKAETGDGQWLRTRDFVRLRSQLIHWTERPP